MSTLMFASQEAVDIVLLPETYRFLGTLHHVTERHLILTCHREDAAFCHAGQKVLVSQVEDGHCYQIEATILQTHASGFAIAHLPPRKLERRRSPRIECELEGKYLHLRPRTLGSKVLEETEHTALVKDLSIGGARLAVQELIIAGAPIQLKFEVERGEVIEAVTTSIRCTAAATPIKCGDRFFTMQAMVKFDSIPRVDQLRLVRFMHRNLGANTALVDSAPALNPTRLPETEALRKEA